MRTILTRSFYAAVLLIALIGSADAAHTHWLHWPLLASFLAVGVVELGGAALSAHADARRIVGERAIMTRILSAAVAGGAVAVNLFGHADQPGQAAFFAGVSALGYLVWLIESGARRRDALRTARMIDRTAPFYGLSWVLHPALTYRAHTIALASSTVLGKVESLDLAREAVRRAARLDAIGTALRSRITAALDPTMAKIAVNTYDLDRVAQGLADGADYAGLTGILAADLVPARITADRSSAVAVNAVYGKEIDVVSAYPELPALDAAPTVAEIAPESPMPTDLRDVSKRQAIALAHAAMGQDIPATKVVEFLAQRGILVSRSTVYAVRNTVPSPAEFVTPEPAPSVKPAARKRTTKTPAKSVPTKTTTAPRKRSTPARPTMAPTDNVVSINR